MSDPENIGDAIREQAIRRRAERAKIALISSTPCEDIHKGMDFDGAEAEQEQQLLANKENEGPSSPALALLVSANQEEAQHQQQQRQQHQQHRSPPSRPTSANNSAARCRSPTEENTTIAQLKSRVATLESESDSLRAVVDLCRRENAAIKSVLTKVACCALGIEWKATVDVKAEEGVMLAGCGQPTAELTMAQRERLIGLLNGAQPNLLP